VLSVCVSLPSGVCDNIAAFVFHCYNASLVVAFAQTEQNVAAPIKRAWIIFLFAKLECIALCYDLTGALGDHTVLTIGEEKESYK